MVRVFNCYLIFYFVTYFNTATKRNGGEYNPLCAPYKKNGRKTGKQEKDGKTGKQVKTGKSGKHDKDGKNRKQKNDGKTSKQKIPENPKNPGRKRRNNSTWLISKRLFTQPKFPICTEFTTSFSCLLSD